MPEFETPARENPPSSATSSPVSPGLDSNSSGPANTDPSPSNPSRSGALRSGPFRPGLFGNVALPAPSLWLKRIPWAVLGGAVLLAMCVLAFELGNLKKERDFTTQVTLEKGGSLINALEGALQTGSGFHWTNAELQALMRRVGSGADIRALALVNAGGRVLLGVPGAEVRKASPSTSPSAPPSAAPAGGATGEVLAQWNTPPPEALHLVMLPQPDGRVRITRRIRVDSGDMHSDHGHGGVRSVLRLARPGTALWVAVEYDAAAIDAAQQSDRTHRVVIGAILAFITFLGGMTWYLVRGYVRSRQVAQETSAFAGHVVRTLPVGVLATDAEDRITVINAEALRITGMTSQEAVGRSLPTFWPELWNPLAASLRPGESLLDRELRCAFRGRPPMPLSVSASPLHTEHGESLGFVLIVRDLGEIRHLQAELRRRDRLAALGTLAARVAHEVRNPLSAIRGIARYFEECYPAGSEDAELAQTLGQEVLRLDKVVGELLDLARPDVIERHPIALDALVERARRMAAPAMQEQNVDFTAHVPSPAPMVMVDGDRMGQVLINLLLNAVDAMQESPCKHLAVRAALEASADGEALLTLEVEDSGCGIAPDKMQDIFSPYYTTKARGTGLGLSIVHKIVEAHGGVIEVKNGEGGGCVMVVRLPVPPLPSVQPLLSGAPVVPAPSTSPSPSES